MRFIFLLILPIFVTHAQQVADTTYSPSVEAHTHSFVKKRIYIDGFHNNFHTLSGGFRPFARILQEDGYDVRSWNEVFTKENLLDADILVIANALHASNQQNWDLPNPSAFNNTEIQSIVNWVSEGGSLFLIADHMPFAGAAGALASAFGFTLHNCFVIDTLNNRNGDAFTRNNGLLPVHRLTASTDTIISFTGLAFDTPKEAVSLLTLDKRFTMFLPSRAWIFDTDCKTTAAEGKSQLAAMRFGKGKIILGGEAAMFTAQISGNAKVGMNAPHARDNYLLLLNLIHWLSV